MTIMMVRLLKCVLADMHLLLLIQLTFVTAFSLRSVLDYLSDCPTALSLLHRVLLSRNVHDGSARLAQGVR